MKTKTNGYEETTLILAAMPVEVNAMLEQVACDQETSVQGIQLSIGSRDGKRCVIAHMGIGKVNAAMTSALLINHFKPNQVMCVGVGGGLNPALQVGDTIIAKKVIQHDHGQLNGDGFEVWETRNPIDKNKNPLFIPADTTLSILAEKSHTQGDLSVAALQKAGHQSAAIVSGVIVTGDAFIVSPKKRKELWQTYHADAIDMEGAAVAQVCWQLGVPHLIIRSISDVDEENVEHDWQTYLAMASGNAAAVAAIVIDNMVEVVQ